MNGLRRMFLGLGLMAILGSGCSYRRLVDVDADAGGMDGGFSDKGTESGMGGAAGMGGSGVAGTGGLGANAGTGGTAVAGSGGVPVSGAAGTGGFGANAGTGGTAVAGSGGVSGAAGGSGCGDLQGDNRNCGSCGHDCLGGACVAGQCQPKLIAQYLGRPDHIAVSETHLCYKADTNYVGCSKKDGSELRPFAYPGTTAVAAPGTLIWVDSGKLLFVWAPPGMAWRLGVCSLVSCDTTLVPAGEDWAQHAAVDPIAHRFFWQQSDGFYALSSQGGALPTKLATSALPPQLARPMTYRKGNLYFPSDQGIYRLPVNDTGTVTTPVLISTSGGTSSSRKSIAANDEMLFWIFGTGINAVPLPNGIGGESNIVVHGADASSLVADSDSLYWVSDDGVIETCQTAACSTTRRSLFLPELGPYDIAIDEVSIYWVSRTDAGGIAAGKVWRVAK